MTLSDRDFAATQAMYSIMLTWPRTNNKIEISDYPEICKRAYILADCLLAEGQITNPQVPKENKD